MLKESKKLKSKKLNKKTDLLLRFKEEKSKVIFVSLLLKYPKKARKTNRIFKRITDDWKNIFIKISSKMKYYLNTDSSNYNFIYS